MTPTIFVPLDGSALAEAALPHALTWARITGSSITLARTIESLDYFQALDWPGTSPMAHQRMWERDLAEAQTYLSEVQERLQSSDIRIITTLLEGEPASAILAQTQTSDAVTMIVMATHGRSGLRRWIMGSVAEKVLHGATKPLLLIRATDDVPPLDLTNLPDYHTIMVPLDGSSFAEHALEHATKLATATNAQLVVASVVSPPINVAVGETSGVPLWTLADQHEALQHTETYLKELCTRLSTDTLHVSPRLCEGYPPEELLQTCVDDAIDLVVMSTHGRRGLSRVWMGSTALKVVQGATVPVLLLHGHTPAHQPQHVAATEHSAAD